MRKSNLNILLSIHETGRDVASEKAGEGRI